MLNVSACSVMLYDELLQPHQIVRPYIVGVLLLLLLLFRRRYLAFAFPLRAFVAIEVEVEFELVTFEVEFELAAFEFGAIFTLEVDAVVFEVDAVVSLEFVGAALGLTVTKSLSNDPVEIITRHVGQVPDSRIHVETHSLWNIWPHFVATISSSPLKSIQILQSSVISPLVDAFVFAGILFSDTLSPFFFSIFELRLRYCDDEADND